MRFALTDEQAGFARSLDDLLAASDTPRVIRAWASGHPAPGLKLWSRLAQLGVTSLAVPDSGATAADLVVAFEQLGRHAVPGPWVESAVFLPTLLGQDPGDAVSTVGVPLALDADVATTTYALNGPVLSTATVHQLRPSIDPARRLFTVLAAEPVTEASPASVASAQDLAAVAVAAQLVGLGLRVLEDTVAYAKARIQFDRPIGSFQAVKHQLADAKVALDFARPLVWGAALTGTPVDVSAAKVAAGDAAYRAARAGLQAHGAVGYTAEYDLGLWLLRIRALRGAWGTPSDHRSRILGSLTASSAGV